MLNNRINGTLAVSRSLGDFQFKKEGFVKYKNTVLIEDAISNDPEVC